MALKFLSQVLYLLVAYIIYKRIFQIYHFFSHDQKKVFPLLGINLHSDAPQAGINWIRAHISQIFRDL